VVTSPSHDVGCPSYWARPWVRCTVLPLEANTACSARNPPPFVDVTLTPCNPVAPGKLRPTSSVSCPFGGSVACCCAVRPSSAGPARGAASVVTSDQPIVVEQPEYSGAPNGMRAAGSDVFGRNGVA